MDDYFKTFNGNPLIILEDQYLPIIGYKQARTHRKKRINKKWRKRYGMEPVRNTRFLVVLDRPFGLKTIIASREIYNEMAETVRIIDDFSKKVMEEIGL